MQEQLPRDVALELTWTYSQRVLEQDTTPHRRSKRIRLDTHLTRLTSLTLPLHNTHCAFSRPTDMLISDSHQFIFLRMRKVASTSMKTILLPMCLPRPAGRIAHLKSRAHLEWDYHKYVFRAHDDICAAKRRMPEEQFKRYFKFAFVRNPWDRLVSEYNFLLERPAHGRHKKVRKLDGFKQFIEMQIPRTDAYQTNMLCDSEGKLLMDFVGKLENINHDWQIVCSKIGIPYQELQRKNTSNHQHYQDYYDTETRQLVARHWSKEIELFEYNFDGDN